MHRLRSACLVVSLMLPAMSVAMGDQVTMRQVGVLVEVEANRLVFSGPGNATTRIGFTCRPSVCLKAAQFSVGDEVLAHFGAEKGKNQLLFIRRCLDSDPECARVREELALEQVQGSARRDIWLERHEACRNQMQLSLASDTRYIASDEHASGSEDSDRVRLEYNSLIADRQLRACMEGVVFGHQDAVLEACEKHRCGEDVGGGCSHISGYSVTTAVLARAIESCGN